MPRRTLRRSGAFLTPVASRILVTARTWHRPGHAAAGTPSKALVIVGAIVALGAAACQTPQPVQPPPAALSASPVQSSPPAPPDHHQHSGSHSSVGAAAAHTTGTCDKSLWGHIYHPYRLQVLSPCKTVTATVTAVYYEPDGDLHIWLSTGLLAEAICLGHVTQSDAVSACHGFSYPVTVPAAGDRVTVTGTYVYDRDHNWREIHPVSSLKIVGYSASSGGSGGSYDSDGSPGSSGAASCTASASYNSAYGDYDVYVHSNQPDKTATASGGGYTRSWYTDSSGYADIYWRGPSGVTITVTVGSARCTTTS